MGRRRAGLADRRRRLAWRAPDLAAARLVTVRAPTLLIVGSRDDVVIELNRKAQSLMTECDSASSSSSREPRTCSRRLARSPRLPATRGTGSSSTYSTPQWATPMTVAKLGRDRTVGLGHVGQSKPSGIRRQWS